MLPSGMLLWEYIEERLVEYERLRREIATSIISELKNDCSTYGELEKKLDSIHLDFTSYGDRGRVEFYSYISSLIQKEKSNLPVTNRSGT